MTTEAPFKEGDIVRYVAGPWERFSGIDLVVTRCYRQYKNWYVSFQVDCENFEGYFSWRFRLVDEPITHEILI